MWAILFALATLPAPDPLIDRVDLIEINHVYDGAGKPIHTQAIFYAWRPHQGRHDVLAWRLLKTDDARQPLPGQYPERDWRTGEWIMVFTEGHYLREVRAAHFRETWTQYDPEVAERDNLPKQKRTGLTKPTP